MPAQMRIIFISAPFQLSTKEDLLTWHEIVMPKAELQVNQRSNFKLHFWILLTANDILFLLIK
jgi:hypothetical protein